MEKKNWAIVDDDLIFHLTTKMLLQKKDVHKKILLFKNGKEAFDYLKNHQETSDDLPDIILLDLNMPVMDGWDFIEHYLPIRSDLPKEITVYIVTSSMDDEDMKRASEISAIKKYVIKPIDQYKLEEIIDDLAA